MKELINHHNISKIREKLSIFSEFIKISIFFTNENFIITKYTPLSSSVHMIAEDCNHNELHIEDCNCGYGGTGPHNTVRVLKEIGLKNTENELNKLVFFNDALQFSIKNSQIDYSSIDTSFVFYPTIRKKEWQQIPLDGNVYIDITKKKVIFINPQHHFIEFLNFISRITISEFEYYVGNNSPLANYLGVESLKDSNFNSEKPNLKDIEHVNLSLRNKNIEIYCLISRKQEIQVINAIYLALKNEPLFPTEKYEIVLKQKSKFVLALKEFFNINKKTAVHNKIILNLEDKG